MTENAIFLSDPRIQALLAACETDPLAVEDDWAHFLGLPAPDYLGDGTYVFQGKVYDRQEMILEMAKRLDPVSEDLVLVDTLQCRNCKTVVQETGQTLTACPECGASLEAIEPTVCACEKCQALLRRPNHRKTESSGQKEKSAQPAEVVNSHRADDPPSGDRQNSAEGVREPYWFEQPAKDAIRRIKQAETRGTGCLLTEEMVQALCVTSFACDLDDS